MDGQTRLKAEIRNAIKLLVETTTMSQHNAKIMARFGVLKEAYKDQNEYEVPFVIRPIIKDGDGDFGIPIFPQDYEKLSLKTFEECFADGKKTAVNPWVGQSVSRVEEVAREES
jgi:hypothetical protein